MQTPNQARRWRTLWYALLLTSVFVGVAVLAARGNNGTNAGNTTHFFVVLADQADTRAAANIDDLELRQQTVYQELTAHAVQTQADLRRVLDAQNVPYTPYYLVNGIEVAGDAALRAQLAQRSDVDRILASPQRDPINDDWFFAQDLGPLQDDLTSDIQPNLNAVRAPETWTDLGVRGAGIVVGGADTGIDWTHPSIRERYAGTPDNHDYTWYDAWQNSSVPNDWNGHGTHTIGTMVGGDGIGVAPDAQWIGCMNMGPTFLNAPAYIDCMQFLFAPFPHGGDPLADGDPTRGAHIVNNSWGCPTNEGCDQTTLNVAVAHLENAGQFYVVSAGNSGPSCGTIGNPAFSINVVSVGAVTNAGALASFSSRGPVVTADGTLIKPEVVAPGVNVMSSVPGNKYRAASGTSMSGPHVVGVVALMWSANPELIGDVTTTRTLLFDSAAAIPLEENRPVCGSDGVPNNLYGMGMVDAYAAVQAALAAR